MMLTSWMAAAFSLVAAALTDMIYNACCSTSAVKTSCSFNDLIVYRQANARAHTGDSTEDTSRQCSYALRSSLVAQCSLFRRHVKRLKGWQWFQRLAVLVHRVRGLGNNRCETTSNAGLPEVPDI